MNVVCANVWVGTVSKFGPFFYLFFVIAYIIAEANKQLSKHERLVCVFQLAVWPIFFLSLRIAHANFNILDSDRVWRSRKRSVAFFVALFCIALLHSLATVVNFIEYGDEDCTKDIFSLCSYGQKNFYIMLLISMIVQIFFVTLEVWIWVASRNDRPSVKSDPLPREERLQRSKDGEDTVTLEPHSSILDGESDDV